MKERKISGSKDSLTVNIPKRFADYLGVKRGDKVEIDLLSDRILVVRKLNGSERSIRSEVIDGLVEEWKKYERKIYRKKISG